MTTLLTPQAGYTALLQRFNRPLAVAQVFNPTALVGLDADGHATPFLSGTVSGIQYALGLLDPAQFQASFTSGSASQGVVVEGIFSLANGTSGNALTQADVGNPCYTADGLTANLTSSTNPLPVTGTTTGQFLGVFEGFDPSTPGRVLISVLAEINVAILGINQALSGYVTLDSAQTIGGAKTFLDGALQVESTSGYSATLDNAGTSDHTISLPDATCTLAQHGAALTSAAVVETTGITVTWSSNVATQTAGGIVAAAHTLCGGFADDGTNTALIIDNTACTATTGTITVAPELTMLPVPTGTTIKVVPPANFTATQT